MAKRAAETSRPFAGVLAVALIVTTLVAFTAAGWAAIWVSKEELGQRREPGEPSGDIPTER